MGEDKQDQYVLAVDRVITVGDILAVVVADTMEHAKQAVSMEPDNYEYQMLLQQLQGNGSWYQQRQSTYQNPYSTGGDWCMKICMLNLMCNCCFGGRYWC